MGNKRNRRAVFAAAIGVLLTVVVVTALVFTTRNSFAQPGPHQHGTQRYGPYTTTRPDEGSCGNIWATADAVSVYSVNTTPNADGTYSVTEDFTGTTFTTTGDGNSPGSCDPGHTASPDPANATGTVTGSWDITVSGGTYNPDATCTSATCGWVADFVHTVFGDGATLTIPRLSFTYNATSCGTWRNATADRGGDRGDITC